MLVVVSRWKEPRVLEIVKGVVLGITFLIKVGVRKGFTHAFSVEKRDT